VTAGLTCDDVRNRELIERYAAGTLGEAEAEALEAHAFGCEACWQGIQSAVEIRAAMLAAPDVLRTQTSPPQRQRRVRWHTAVPIAMAAVALFGIGMAIVIQHRQTTVRPPALRSAAADTIRLTATPQADGSIKVEWPAHPSASDYVISVQAGGATVLTAETSELQYVLPGERLEAGSPVVVGVAAQAPDGATLATGSVALTGR
jgi:hypothetical protein